MKNGILVVNGPNPNLLGERETDKYGKETLDEIVSRLKKKAIEKGYEIYDFQSNSEGEIIDFIANNADRSIAMIINPAAYTHTSIAIRDVILAKKISTVEVHLSNIYKRESFRHQSYIHDIAIGMIIGLGGMGYDYALDYILNHIGNIK